MLTCGTSSNGHKIKVMFLLFIFIDKPFTNLFSRICATIYIGWGQKYNAHNHSPEGMPDIQQEYPIGPEIMEMTDPTFAEEEVNILIIYRIKP